MSWDEMSKNEQLAEVRRAAQAAARSSDKSCGTCGGYAGCDEDGVIFREINEEIDKATTIAVRSSFS
jgi:hypothetical protein